MLGICLGNRRKFYIIFQASADLDFSMQSMKENMDKLQELLMEASEKMKSNNKRQKIEQISFCVTKYILG